MKTAYLDQNVYGHLLDSGNWRTHPLGKILLENSDKVEVWLSPTHVIELSQASNPTRRMHLAKLMLELSHARRMWHGPDFYLVEMFGEFLNAQVPGAFDPQPFFNEYKEDASRLWLGYLGLLAAVEDLKLGPGGDIIRRWKRESHLLHSRFAANPREEFDKIIAAAQRLDTTHDPDPLGLGKLTEEQLNAEVAGFRAAAASVDKRQIVEARKRIERHRKEVARVYGAIDIGMALQAVFRLPCDLEFTFNACALVAGWSKIQTVSGVSLPRSVKSIPISELRGRPDALAELLNAAINAAANCGLAAASIGYYSLIRELEICINARTTPTEGAVLDVDHATAALAFQVFVCHDQKLYANVSAFLNSFKIEGHEAVFNEHQLKSALGL